MSNYMPNNINCHGSNFPQHFVAVNRVKMIAYDFRKIFISDLFFLRLAGCWAKDSEEIPPFYKYHFYFCNIAVMFAVNFLMTVNWFIETHNLKDASDLGYIILICYMGQAKSYYFYKYRNEFKTLVDMLSDQTFQPRNPEEFESLKIGFQKFWKIKTTMLVLTLISTLCCITTPLISGRLVVRAWYPFELISTIVYCAVYVHQSLAIVLISIINILVDLSIGCFCRFISQQCQLLCMRLVAIANDRDGVCRKKTLLGCIEKHRLMLKFLKTTEKVFGKIYFGQLFASTTALCMDLFLLSLTEPKTFEFFYLVVYLLAVANLLLVPCWFSTEMTRKSENIPFAAYSCDWVDSSNSFKKELIFFIRRAQRPLKFYAVDFFEISVETFVKIIRTSLSYYAVLNNLNMEEKYY